MNADRARRLPSRREEDLPARSLIRRARTNWESRKDGESVRRDLERALSLEPDRARAHRLLATWHLQHGSSTSALHEARRAVVLGSGRAGRIVLAGAFLMRGDTVSAIDGMRRCEGEGVEPAGLLLRLAVHAKRMECWNVVENALLDRLNLRESPNALLALSRLRARRGDAHGALKLHELATRRGLPHRAFLLEHGDLALRAGEHERARAAYAEALSVPGRQGAAWLRLERCFRQTGATRAAERCLDRARALGHSGPPLPDLELAPAPRRTVTDRGGPWDRTLRSLRAFLPRFSSAL